MGAERKFELVTSVLKTSLLRDHAAVFDVCPAAEQAHENVAVDKLMPRRSVVGECQSFPVVAVIDPVQGGPVATC